MAFIKQCRDFGFGMDQVRVLLELSISAGRDCVETRDIAQRHLDEVRQKVAELRLLEYSQRLARRARNVLALPGASTGRALFDAALQGGARALGSGPPGFHPGGEADIVTLRADAIAEVSGDADAALDRWIFAGAGAGIDVVYARGRARVRGGVHVERERIAGRFQSAMLKLLAGPARKSA